MADQVTPDISSDDAAIFSLNSPDSGTDDQQEEDPFKDGRDTIIQASRGMRRIKSGTFPPSNALFRMTPGARKVQW